MTARTSISTDPRPSVSTDRRRGFTLTELLVVIALIVLLISLLLAALGQAQKKSRQATTLATMQAFANACETFQQEHGFYPGVVPEAILANDPKISGTENAILHLMGGFVTQQSDPSKYATYVAPNGWEEIRFNDPNSSDDFRIKVNLRRIGEGPIIDGKPYPPYLTPSDREFGIVEGQWIVEQDQPEQSSNLRLPDLLDAWGQPIIMLRRIRSIGPITLAGGIGGGGGSRPQFRRQPITPYTFARLRDSRGGLGSLGTDQFNDSVLEQAPDKEATLKRILEHPSLPGQARGAFMLLSSGPDGVYFSKRDGAGSQENEVVDIITDYPPQVIGEYDDVLVFGGG